MGQNNVSSWRKYSCLVFTPTQSILPSPIQDIANIVVADRPHPQERPHPALPQRACTRPPLYADYWYTSETTFQHESPSSPPDGATELGNHAGFPIPGNKCSHANYNFITWGGWRDSFATPCTTRLPATHTSLFTFYISSLSWCSPSSTLNNQPQLPSYVFFYALAPGKPSFDGCWVWEQNWDLTDSLQQKRKSHRSPQKPLSS